METVMCSSCRCKFTQDDYFICVNRTCQTVLSALIDQKMCRDIDENRLESSNISNISYPTLTQRTVSIQVDTLALTLSDQRTSAKIIEESEDDSTSSSSNSNWPRSSSSDSSFVSYTTSDSDEHHSWHWTLRHLKYGFNSNQPMKSAKTSEEEKESQRSSPTRNNEQTPNNNTSVTSDTPTSPRCLAIMNVRQRRDRLSTLINLPPNKLSQTLLTSLKESSQAISYENIAPVTMTPTKDLRRNDRQCQVNTLRHYTEDQPEAQIDISDRLGKDSLDNLINDDNILAALVEKDGQRWSQLIEKLIQESTVHRSSTQIAQQLLDRIECLHKNDKLNSLTSGQLQRKIHYAVSQFEHVVEQKRLRQSLQMAKINHPSKKSSDCSGTLDMSVTVRQVDQRHHRQASTPVHHSWKSYVDRLFEQGNSADEIQRSLREAATSSATLDHQKLQEVFDYITSKSKQPRATTAPAGIEFVSKTIKTKEIPHSSTPKSLIFESNLMPLTSKSTAGSKTSKQPSFFSTSKAIKRSELLKISPTSKNETLSNLVSTTDAMIPTFAAESHLRIDPSQISKISDRTTPLSAAIQPISTTDSLIPEQTSPKESTGELSKESSNHSAKNKAIESQSNDVHSHDIKSKDPKERCLYTLRQIRHALKTNREDHSPSISTLSMNDRSPMDKLIDALGSNTALSSKDVDSKEINDLIAQVIDFLTDEKLQTSSMNSSKTHDMNKKLSDALDALRDYQKTISLNPEKHEKVSDSSDHSIPFDQVTAFVDSIILQSSQEMDSSLFKNAIDTQRSSISTDQQENISSPIRCTPIPYTSSSQKPSAVTLQDAPIISNEQLTQSNTMDPQENRAKPSDEEPFESSNPSSMNPSKLSLSTQSVDEQKGSDQFVGTSNIATPNKSKSSLSSQQNEKGIDTYPYQPIQGNYETLSLNEPQERTKSIITPSKSSRILHSDFLLTEPQTAHGGLSASRLRSPESSMNSIIPIATQLQQSTITLSTSKINSNPFLSQSKASSLKQTSGVDLSKISSEVSLSTSVETKKNDSVNSESRLSVHDKISNDPMNEKINISISSMIWNQPLNMKRYVIPTSMHLLDVSETTMHASSMIKIDEEKEQKSISKMSSLQQNQLINDDLQEPILIPPLTNAKEQQTRRILFPSQTKTDEINILSRVPVPEAISGSMKSPVFDDQIIPSGRRSLSQSSIDELFDLPVPSAPTESEEIKEMDSNESILSMTDHPADEVKDQSESNETNNDNQRNTEPQSPDNASSISEPREDSETSLMKSSDKSSNIEDERQIHPESDENDKDSKSELVSDERQVSSNSKLNPSSIQSEEHSDDHEKLSRSSKESSKAVPNVNNPSSTSSTTSKHSDHDATKFDENSKEQSVLTLKSDHEQSSTVSENEKKSLNTQSSRSNELSTFSSASLDDQSSKKSAPEQKTSYSDQLNLSRKIQSNTETQPSSSSHVKQSQSIPSTSTAVRASSIVNVTPEEELNLWTPITDDKNNRSPSTDNQPTTNISRLNLLNMFNQTPEQKSLFKSEESSTSMSKSSRDDHSQSMHRKKPLSLSNSSIDDHDPAVSMSKLLKKRSSLKSSNSSTAKSDKGHASFSITDVSTSSSNTVVTDYLSGSHRTKPDHEESTMTKKPTKTKQIEKESIRNLPTEKPKKIKKRIDRTILSESQQQNNESIPKSDDWMKSQDDVTEILIIDEHQSMRITKDQRKLKKPTKNQMIERSGLLPINLKARGDHQAHTIESSRLPSIEQSTVGNRMKKWSHDSMRRKIICFPVSQIEKFECGTIGPRPHRTSITQQLLSLPSISDRTNNPSGLPSPITSLTDRFYSLFSSDPNENDDDDDVEPFFDSIIDQQQKRQHPCPTLKTNPMKLHYIHLLDKPTNKSTRGRQYPIVADEIDMIDDPNSCTIMNKWAFADLVETERKNFVEKSEKEEKSFRKKSKAEKNLRIFLRKRPLTDFEKNIFKEVDIISVLNEQNLVLHIPSITIDNQVFIKNQKYRCDQTFDESAQMSTIYHSTLAPLVDQAIEGHKCLCLISGGKYSGKTYLLRSLINLISFDLIRLLSTCDIYIRIIGLCHNRLVDLLQNNSPIRLVKSSNWKLIPDEEFQLQNDHDIDFIVEQMKKRRRFIHQCIQMNFRTKDRSNIIGSLMIVMFASSQYIYTRTLCSHRRKFLINSLNRTIFSFRRALLGIRQNPRRIQSAFDHDILTRLIRPYIFDERSKISYIGTLNPGHRHRIATKSTLDFARNLRFCLTKLHKKRRRSQMKMASSFVVHDQHDDRLL